MGAVMVPPNNMHRTGVITNPYRILALWLDLKTPTKWKHFAHGKLESWGAGEWATVRDLLSLTFLPGL